MNIFIKTLILLILGFATYFSLTNEYMTAKEHRATLVEKYQSNGSKGRLRFIHVYKLQSGYLHDTSVSASTYYKLKINDYVSLIERPFDIKQTPRQNILYFFGPVIVLSIFATYFLFWYTPSVYSVIKEKFLIKNN